VCLNILCLISINIHYPWNYAEFDNNAYFNEFSLSTQWNNIDRLHTWLVQTKFNMGTLDLITIISLLAADRSLNLTCPGLAEPNSPLARVIAGQCLKFCDDTLSFATPLLHTLNNPQDLDLDCLAASFPVQWIRAHGSAGKRQCGVNSVPALRPAEKGNYFIFRDGNSRIILNTLQPFSNLYVFIKILSSFVKGTMFVNRNNRTNVTNDAATFAKNI